MYHIFRSTYKEYPVAPGSQKYSYWKEAFRLKKWPLREKIHGYIYMRWPYFYIGTGIGSTWLSKLMNKIIPFWQHLFPPRPAGSDDITFADTYHGKVVPLQTAREIVTVHRDIAVPDLEQVIPYHLARAFILQQPDRIAVLDCPCRTNREHPCLPMDVCLIIGEPFASFVLQHHPDKSRAITQAEAVEILEAEDRRGHVHHAFFKEAVMERFYAICNCCSCCCGAMQAHFQGTPMLASSGYLSQVDDDLCIGCSECAQFCQFSALAVSAGINQVDTDLCMGCGVCVSHCPQGALSLILAPEKGIPLEMSRILASAP
jgi:ferredoxin